MSESNNYEGYEKLSRLFLSRLRHISFLVKMWLKFLAEKPMILETESYVITGRFVITITSTCSIRVCHHTDGHRVSQQDKVTR